MTNRATIHQRSADGLRKGYSRVYRGVEIASITSFALGLGYILWQGRGAIARSPWVATAGLLISYLGADFFGGLVHWLADTWGSVDMPVVGASLLRPFRLHHVDQKEITRHDLIETNGSNCLFSLPGIALALGCNWETDLGLFFGCFWAGVMLFVMMTNQFHMWSHLEPEELGPVIRLLQRARLILPPDHHRVHHTAPFATYYGITNGWLNWPLAKLGFFRGLERLITAVTGAIPRKDDIGLAAALAIAPLPAKPEPAPSAEQG